MRLFRAWFACPIRRLLKLGTGLPFLVQILGNVHDLLFLARVLPLLPHHTRCFLFFETLARRWRLYDRLLFAQELPRDSDSQMRLLWFLRLWTVVVEQVIVCVEVSRQLNELLRFQNFLARRPLMWFDFENASDETFDSRVEVLLELDLVLFDFRHHFVHCPPRKRGSPVKELVQQNAFGLPSAPKFRLPNYLLLLPKSNSVPRDQTSVFFVCFFL